MLDTPIVLNREKQLTAVIHLTVARTAISQVMAPAIAEIVAALATQNIQPSGPLFSYHHKRPGDTFDFELGFPVAQALAPAGRVMMSCLPATQVVQAIYHGAYEGLAAAWGEFCAWSAEAGLDVEANLWEVYAVGPASSADPSAWRTELNRPLRASCTPACHAAPPSLDP